MPHLAREFYGPEELIAAAAIPSKTFTKVISLRSMTVAHRPRFESFLMTELEEVLFLDGDTLLTTAIPEVFELLEQFDLGLTIAPQLHGSQAIKMGIHELLPWVSTALPEYNGGFILAKANEDFRSFVRLWLGLFEKCINVGFMMDQPSLRVAAATSKLRIAVLPNNYNFRANAPQTVNGLVKILHAHADLHAISGFINNTKGFRHYQPSDDYVYGFMPKTFLDRQVSKQTSN